MPDRTTWRPRRTRGRRGTLVFWAGALAMATVVAATVGGAARRADDARRAWGDRVAVAVATAPVAAGTVIEAADVAVRELPAIAVPDGALGESPAGRMAIADLVAGEAIVAARVAPDGRRGAAALVPPGWRALAVPVAGAGAGAGTGMGMGMGAGTGGGTGGAGGPGGMSLSVGDRVDALATFTTGDPAGGSGGPPTVTVAADARVVAVGDGAVAVAVPAADAPRLAFALASGTVVLALRGP